METGEEVCTGKCWSESTYPGLDQSWGKGQPGTWLSWMGWSEYLMRRPLQHPLQLLLLVSAPTPSQAWSSCTYFHLTGEEHRLRRELTLCRWGHRARVTLSVKNHAPSPSSLALPSATYLI